MTYKTFFRCCLLLPIVTIGIFELGFYIWGPAFTKSLPEVIVAMWINLKQGFDFGIIQYLILIAFLAWGIGKWTLRVIKINTLLTPIYYALIMFVSFFIYGLIINDSTASQVGIFAILFSLIYGYFYVCIVFISYFLMKRVGVIKI
jgi:hypothetical protein